LAFFFTSAFSQGSSIHHNPHYTDMTRQKYGHPPSPSHSRFTIFVTVVIAFSCSGAFAQSSDADFCSLLKKRKPAEAEALTRERITRQPRDDMALWYLARITAGDANKRNELIPKV